MTPRRRIAALLTVLAGLMLVVQSAQATIDPTVDMNPASPYTFTPTPVGSSATKTVTVSNPGPDEVFTGAPTLTGVNPGQFSIANNTCTGTVASGGSCSFDVTFAPTVSGAASAGVQFAATPAIAAYQVSGTGTQPQLAFTPSTGLSFAIGIGDTTAPQALSIQNTGDATMNISGITIAGTDAARFAKSSQTCGATLAAGATCTVSVTFTPSAAGVFNAILHVADDALNNPHDANLTGTATIPGVQTTPTSLTFPAQQDGTLGATMQVTVKNTSASASLKVGTLTIGGINGAASSLRRAVMPARGRRSPPVRRAPFRSPSGRCRSRRRAPRCISRATPPRPRTSRCWELRSPRRPSEACTGRRAAPRRTSAGRRQRRTRYVKVLVVRNRSRVPRTPADGTVLTHGAGALNDAGLQVASTYHYSLFTVTNAYDNPSRLIYAKPTSITLKAGRVCTPMNGGKTSDLTPLIDWVAFGKGSSYSLRLTSAAGKTIQVRYTSRTTTQYQVPSQWQYGGSSHKLVRGQTYTVYVYAYNAQYPVGRWIGQSKWTQT